MGTTPNRLDDGLVFGALKMGVLVTLKAETLNWKRCPSRIRKLRINVTSSCGAEFVRIVELRSMDVRNVSGGLTTQILGEVSNQWLSVCPLESLGLP
jgi:hypothetical protein